MSCKLKLSLCCIFTFEHLNPLEWVANGNADQFYTTVSLPGLPWYVLGKAWKGQESSLPNKNQEEFPLS